MEAVSPLNSALTPSYRNEKGAFPYFVRDFVHRMEYALICTMVVVIASISEYLSLHSCPNDPKRVCNYIAK